jgi:spore germination protein GerM
VATVVALLLVGTGCGLSVEDQPRELAADDVPGDLLAPRPTTTTSTTTPAVTRAVKIYLVDSDGRLASVDRELPDPVTVVDLIRSLLDGATDQESERGIRSVIASTTELLSSQRRDRTVVLNFSADFAIPQGEGGITSVAQVVFTATELEGISGVTFQLDGVPTEVPRGDGTLTSDPLFRSDFPQRSPTATTTTTPPEE